MKRILTFAAVLVMLAAAGVQSYAFMAAEKEAAIEGQMDVVELVDNVRDEVESKEAACDTKLASIESALNQIDEMLDAGSSDEDVLLDARDALVQLRLELPCEAKKQLVGNEHGGSIISDRLVGERVVNLGASHNGGGILSGGHTSGGFVSGGYTSGGLVSSGGRAAGRAAASGGGGRLGLLAAGAAAIIIPIAASDDDDAPAPVASAVGN